MKRISLFSKSYLISLTLHLLVLISFVYISYEPRSHIQSFQTSVFFENSTINKKAVRSPQRVSASKLTQEDSLSKKLNLVPGIKKKSILVPETDPFQAPSLKKYITPPKSVPFQTEEPLGFLKSNKRTVKPLLPIISADELPKIQAQPKPSATIHSGSEKTGSRTQNSETQKPYIPNPSFEEADPNRITSSKSRISSIWQKKSDLMVYRNSLAKLVTANWIVPPTSVKKFQILIAAHIGPRGNLVSIQSIKSSGLAILDAAAERAIRVSTPFPEFPKSFKAEQKFYRAVFRFTPDKVAN